MSAVDAAGESAMRGLISSAFAAGEPGLPDVDDVMAAVETLGAGIRRRQRVRTGVTAAVLCVAGFGMVAGIAAVAHSPHSGGTTVMVPGGSGGAEPPPIAGDSGNGGRLPPP
jgi:hypothetical protein